MKLSVIIVNYNVRYFLEQCLHSVREASKGLEVEVFVVDNASVDGSVKMVGEKFAGTHCIANTENVGFAKANNQAISIAKGEYILLLNPDTVIETDTFSKVIGFMDQHPDAGGLGVKMVDGKGNFLPESKRGLPTPVVAFYKIFGLSRLFPHSPRFNKYHLGYLDKNKTHKVDVLSGACMLVRKSILDSIGYLDEQFFMYGEDIDLSYRIVKAGFCNYYFPETRIIHYKGESTKKGSLNYVFVFYNAMIIFAKKHFSPQNARVFSIFINLAIYFRASLSVAFRVLRKAFLPLIDMLFTFAGIFALARYWELKVIYPNGGHYPVEFYSFILPGYLIAWLLAVYFSGGYDRPVKIWKSLQGMATGTVIILVIYALLPAQFRFSRMLTIFGAAWGMISMSGIRLILHLLNIQEYRFGVGQSKRFVIVGEDEESHRVADLLKKALNNPGFIGLVKSGNGLVDKNGFLGNLSQVQEIIKVYSIDEVIFCARDVPAQVIIDQMAALQGLEVDFKIAPPESLSIIGSNSINTAGDLYVIDINSINKVNNRRNKRVFDVITSLALLISYPVTAFIVKDPANFLLNILKVLAGARSWSGYAPVVAHDNKLPGIRAGILHPTDAFGKTGLDEQSVQRLNILYARDYHLLGEFRIIFKGFRNLGRK
ncbi:MAG: glycosyltransferase [Bacteroidetes bacterium]|nr:glycosyltransferase [Bacteroidota bacterium]